MFLGGKIAIAGNIVDQQSALFGQACFRPGTVKTTYGTGCFMLMNTGHKIVDSPNGLLTTVAWGLDDKMSFALRWRSLHYRGCNPVVAGRPGDYSKCQGDRNYCEFSRDTGDVYFVPAFTGLAAPYWDQYARGMMIGMTGGTTKAHIVRATLESIAFQVNENLKVMRKIQESLLMS
jgi:glycerol kinase